MHNTHNALQAINPSTAGTAVFTLTVTFDANNRTLSAVEGESLTSIYTRYCVALSRVMTTVVNLGHAIISNHHGCLDVKLLSKVALIATAC